MDNITHGLLGLTIGMLRRRDGGLEHDAPLSDTDKAVMWATLAAAELPDIDVFFTIGKGPMAEYAIHRGWTHALLMAPVVALVATAATMLIWRKAKAGTVYAWSLGAVLVAHLTNDWFTGWGTRLLLPFSQARVGLDWVGIVDLLYTLPLLIAVIAAWKRPQLRRRAAATVLSYLAVYAIGYRGVTHTLVERAVAAHYGQAAQQVRVSPNMLNPLAWQFTVDLGDRFEQGTAYPFDNIAPSRTAAKLPETDPVVQALRSAPELKPFFEQFHFVQITYRKEGGGYAANIGDIRYGAAGRGGMSYTVRLGDDLRVVDIGGSAH